MLFEATATGKATLAPNRRFDVSPPGRLRGATTLIFDISNNHGTILTIIDLTISGLLFAHPLYPRKFCAMTQSALGDVILANVDFPEEE